MRKNAKDVATYLEIKKGEQRRTLFQHLVDNLPVGDDRREDAKQGLTDMALEELHNWKKARRCVPWSMCAVP